MENGGFIKKQSGLAAAVEVQKKATTHI